VLAGTENGSDPFLSPDGQWIGFFAERTLKKISVQGGAAITLSATRSAGGASWGEDGNIVAEIGNAGLFLIPTGGGNPQRLTTTGGAQGVAHRWPQVLPGGRAIIFTGSNTAARAFEDASIEVLSLKTKEIKKLINGGYYGRYLATGLDNGLGHLLYVHDGSLFAVPFDPDRLEIRGTPVPVLEDIAANPQTGAGQFGFSDTGTMVYRSGKAALETWPVLWLDSFGKIETLLSKQDGYTGPHFSPDGQRLALSLGAGSTRGIYIYDWKRETMSHLSFPMPGNVYPIWSPDGKHLVLRSTSPQGSVIQWTRADGTGGVQNLLESKYFIAPNSFSPDGRHLAYRENNPDSGVDLWTLPLDPSDPDHPKPGKPELFLRTPFAEHHPAFSPDGRWMAYQSDESGRYEVYVRPFPGPGEKWQVSNGGGQMPIWSRNGREIFFETLDNRIMVTDYGVKGESFTSEKPRIWSNVKIREIGDLWNLDLAPDGKRFAVFPLPDAGGERKGMVHVAFLENFFDELRRKVPGK
jgi:serine/threonine-protein kinase